MSKNRIRLLFIIFHLAVLSFLLFAEETVNPELNADLARLRAGISGCGFFQYLMILRRMTGK